ncbi:MAG: hypothetical protein LBQ66_01725 [Planctomycetaceae bacterium]|jgi:hypothetical protein|nr:hypothetical protein [Planctomycetaceae bacterium]
MGKNHVQVSQGFWILLSSFAQYIANELVNEFGKDGEPVIQLKTASGDGKNHSMLALYHTTRGNVPIDKIPNVKPVLQRAGVAVLPKTNVVG